MRSSIFSSRSSRITGESSKGSSGGGSIIFSRSISSRVLRIVHRFVLTPVLSVISRAIWA